MSNLIDKQAVIDALKNDMASLDHIIKGMSAYDVKLDAYVSQRNQVNCDIDTINNLPTVQLEPCDDVVSRKAVIDSVRQDCFAVFTADERMYEIRDLPPVTPKQRTGYWYPVGMAEVVGGESAQWGSAIAYHRCSECDEQALRDDFEQEVLSEFCPHCGVKMEGVSNESN